MYSNSKGGNKMKKAQLKAGIDIRKKSWKRYDIFATITAFSDENVLIKFSKNCEYSGGKERRMPMFLILRDWEINEDQYIGKKYILKYNELKLFPRKINVIDSFINKADKSEYIIYSENNASIPNMMLMSDFNRLYVEYNDNELKSKYFDKIKKAIDSNDAIFDEIRYLIKEYDKENSH